MQKKQWKDFSPMTRARITVMGIVQVALLIAALWDIRRRPAEAINGSKKMWYGLAFINFVGPIAYFLFGRKRGVQLAPSAIMSDD
ncbi:MAG: PLDc N-terminal domain-containing protein [Caldilineaceae bacterium]|nr:PLDc N-terminal domain-containing protein [Caldilineaceae bacterium]